MSGRKRAAEQVHHLKIWPDFFAKVRRGDKTAEIRLDDRDFRIGDKLVLREWKPRAKRFTGRFEERVITDITWLSQWVPGVTEPYCVLHMGAIT